MSLRQNALFLAAMTVLLAIIGEWSGSEQLAGVWRLPLALLLLGLAYEGWMVMRARVQAELSAPQSFCVLGRPATLRLRLSHQLAREVTVAVAPDPPAALQTDTSVQTATIGAADSATLQLLVTARQLGEHRWPGLRLRMAGPLGLAWWPRPVPAQFTLRVVPDLLHESAQRGGTAGSGVQSRLQAGAGGEILQLRDYRPGDPQHVIDWKASARSNRLVSRDFSMDQHLEIVLVVDAGRASALKAGELDRLGHYANIAARFAERAVAKDDDVGLMIFADRPLAVIAPGRGIATVSRIRALLAAARPASAESNPLGAALRVRTLVRHRSLVVMLTDLDDAAVTGQLASAVRLLLPKHLPLIAGLSSPEALARSHAPAHTWLDPYEALAAQEYCARLERNAAALRALGAPTLLVRPQQMEQAVFEAYAEFRRRRRI